MIADAFESTAAPPRKPKVIELFSGAGLFGLAFQKEGFQLSMAYERDPVAAAIMATGLAITAWVIYMFYARLRDIADELRKIRIAYKGTIDRDVERREGQEADE